MRAGVAGGGAVFAYLIERMVSVQNREDQGLDPTPTGQHMCGMGWDCAIDDRSDVELP
jgi:hypothetical protein